MKTNMGSTDRMIRIALAIVFGILYFTNVISGTLGLVLMVLAAIFLVTSFVKFCPIYAVLGLNTCGVKEK